MRLAILLLAALPLAAAADPAAAEEMSGRWTIEGDVQGNQVNLNCTLAQSDSKLAGKCEVNGMEVTEIAGDVKDAEFKFSFTVAGYTLTYTGKWQGDTVGGDIEVAGVGGKFTGKRVKE